MIVDLVVDTNVLVHASNNNFCKQQNCIDVIERLLNSNECICMDENGFINFEYQKHLKHGSLGATLLLVLLNAKPIRIKYLDREIPAVINKRINTTGIKKSDRIFVRIAFKSVDKILVTHDYEDFTTKKREYFNDSIGVSVMESGEFIENY